MVQTLRGLRRQSWFDSKSDHQKTLVSEIMGKVEIPTNKAFEYSYIVQLVEHLTVNQGVTGSSPVVGATCLCRRTLVWF